MASLMSSFQGLLLLQHHNLSAALIINLRTSHLPVQAEDTQTQQDIHISC